MVYYVMARGGPGFQIMSEDNRMTIFIDNFHIIPKTTNDKGKEIKSRK